MSVVTITVSDVDVLDSTYKVDFATAGSLLDDGQATAAMFTAYYLQTILNTVEFRADCKQYGDNLVASMKAQYPDMLNTTVPAKMIVTLEDADLGKGSYRSGLQSEGGDPTGHSLPTAAQIVGAYITSLLYDMNFRMNMWSFAKEYVAKNEGASLGNPDQRPITLNLNDEAARCAA